MKLKCVSKHDTSTYMVNSKYLSFYPFFSCLASFPCMFLYLISHSNTQINSGCTQSVCLKCCTDIQGCIVHKEQRDQAMFRDQVLQGTTDLQKALQEKRSKLIVKGRFRESGFTYMGDTVIIWNLREYLANSKWKEEALRKSSKRRHHCRSNQLRNPSATNGKSNKGSNPGKKKL